MLGAGRMGSALAGRLLGKGHRVTAWNRSPGRIEALVEAGARRAPDPPSAAIGAQVVICCVADDVSDRATLLESGLPQALEAGSIVVDCSTVSPATSRALSAGLGDGRLVAAPVMGAPSAVAGGEAAYLLAGAPAALERLGWLWSDLGGHCRVVGEDPGDALELKVLSNALLLGGLALLAEVVATAEQLGHEPQALRALFGEHPMVAPGLRNRLEALWDPGHEGWFSVRLGIKDAELARDLEDHAGVSPAMLAAASLRYQAAAEAGWQEADIAAVIEASVPPGTRAARERAAAPDS